MKKTSLTKGILEEMYDNAAKRNPWVKFVYFQGVRFRTGSRSLKKAIADWRKKNAKKV